MSKLMQVSGELVPIEVVDAEIVSDVRLAILVDAELPSAEGVSQRLYRCEPPMEGSEYVVVSASILPVIPETYIFAADSSGYITDFGELPGSFQGALDHEQALARAGYAAVHELKSTTMLELPAPMLGACNGD